MSGTNGTEVCERDRQQELAASLISTFGIEGAVRACRSNGWDGVLEKVLLRANEGLRKAANRSAAPQSRLGSRSSGRDLAMNRIRVNSRVNVALLLKAAAVTGFLFLAVAVPFLGILWQIGVLGR